MEHYRLGSTRAILSRSFCNTDKITDISDIEAVFEENMRKLRLFEEKVEQITDFSNNQKEVRNIVEHIVEVKKGN